MTALKFQSYICLSALLLSAASLAQAGPCTNASLVGTYGIQEQGMHIDAAGQFTEFRTIGTIRFDGTGKGDKKQTLWFSDFSINPVEAAITYAVRPDCSFTFTDGSDGELYEGVIVANGTKLLYMETSGQPVRSGQGEKIRTPQ